MKERRTYSQIIKRNPRENLHPYLSGTCDLCIECSINHATHGNGVIKAADLKRPKQKSQGGEVEGDPCEMTLSREQNATPCWWVDI